MANNAATKLNPDVTNIYFPPVIHNDVRSNSFPLDYILILKLFNL